jgi:DNA invertase Pin-like site-specific DNA recombinase
LSEWERETVMEMKFSIAVFCARGAKMGDSFKVRKIYVNEKKIYGYVRVSSKDQNEDRQMIAMKDMNIQEKNIFMDKQSGKDFERPKYKKMLEKLKENDILYVKSIDRLGRNYEEILEQWRMITKEKRADIVVMDMPLLDTRREKNLLGTFIADLVLQILSYVSETERVTTKQRQREGIEAAKLKGVQFGRPSKNYPDNWETLVKKYENGELSAKAVADECGISASTFYRRVKKMRAVGEK